jgi:hypothetical protein
VRIAPGALRDELRRDPVHPDAQGPLDPLKHQIDIADLQDTRYFLLLIASFSVLMAMVV